MDIRTANLLRAIDATALEILVALLERPRSEKALVEDLENVAQSSAHKKLQRMEQAGLLRAPAEGTRGQPWEVAAPLPTSAYVESLLALSDSLDAVDAQSRAVTRDRLARRPARPSSGGR